MEALERRGKWLAVAGILFIVFWSQCQGVEGRNSTKMSYVCPPQFIRLGHSCYYFSESKATWQNALFACKDRDSNLTVPARWEDRNLRNYLNLPSIEKASRWIGGIYDYGSKSWKWGGELLKMRYQSFSKMKRMKPEELQWHCIAMMPDLFYRWAPKSCIEPRQYICQTKIRKIPKSKVKDLKRRWQRMGKINEITAPSVSRENNDAFNNDVTSNPVVNPKSYDLRPAPLRLGAEDHRPVPGKKRIRPFALKKRSKGTHAQGRLTPPFPGYSWNRMDPEASFQRNADLLRSGKTGLSPQQIKSHLARLSHLRNKQLHRLRMRKKHGERPLNDRPLNDTPKQPRPLVQVHAKTYTIDNNISALHPKMIVEEFDMLPPPPSVSVPRNVRGAYPYPRLQG